MTLLLPKPWAGAGIWTKQDFEESLGKSKTIGIKIVTGEPIALVNYRPPRDPKQDRVFLSIQIEGVTNGNAAKVQALRRVGYPVAAVTFPKASSLSAYMQFMHYAVFGLAWLRQMNFVTQPGVELYKAWTAKLHASGDANGLTSAVPHRLGRSVTLDTKFCPQARGESAPETLAWLIAFSFQNAGATYGELSFFGDTRYSAQGRRALKAIDRGAGLLFRSLLKAPADVYEGPAMNHSYHEMIIGYGNCFSIVMASEKNENDRPPELRPELSSRPIPRDPDRARRARTLRSRTRREGSRAAHDPRTGRILPRNGTMFKGPSEAPRLQAALTAHGKNQTR